MTIEDNEPRDVRAALARISSGTALTQLYSGAALAAWFPFVAVVALLHLDGDPIRLSIGLSGLLFGQLLGAAWSMKIAPVTVVDYGRLLVGSIVCMLGLAGVGLATGEAGIFAGLAAVGFGKGLIDPVHDHLGSVVARHAPVVRKSSRYLFAGVQLGAALVASGAIAMHSSPRVWLLTVAANGMLIMVFGALLVRSGQRMLPALSGVEQRDSRPDRRPFWPMWLGCIIAVGAAGTLIESGWGSWGGLFLVKDLRATPGAASLGYVCFAVGVAAAAVLVTPVVERVGRPRTVLACSLLLCLGGLVVVGAHTIPVVLVGAAITGLAVGQLPALARDSIGDDRFPAALWIGASTFVFGLAPVVMGTLAANLDVRSAMWSIPVLAVVVVVTAAATEGIHRLADGEAADPS